MTGVIDYEAGNTLSVIKALEYLGQSVEFTRDPQKLASCDRLVFPGVGAYYAAMRRLENFGLIPVIKDAVKNGIPFLGICLGMQLLFENSEEVIGCNDPGITLVEGLGILPGRIRRFENKEGYKIPHMGWNSIYGIGSSSKMLKGINNGTYFYFVHSYYLEAPDSLNVAAKTDYINTFDSAAERQNVFGCQFHPEKSGEQGLLILKNFCTL